MRKIVVAPDSFKGSLPSMTICNLAEKAAKEVLGEAEVVKIPIADGGEGTVDAIITATGGKICSVRVSGPLGDPVEASYGIAENKVIIEMAQASGLPLAGDRKNPLAATTYGTGQLILHAVAGGYRDIVVAIGGSATNDGGTGALEALGVRFFDREGKELTGLCGEMLPQIARIDAAAAREKLKDVRLSVMCDVDNPLTGERGATYVFGPQKGADTEMLAQLESGMKSYAEVMDETAGSRLSEIPGTGAAGGLGYGLMAVFGAELKPGITAVLEFVNFAGLAKDADLILTGEGAIDFQSAYGKVLWGIGKEAKALQVPAVAVAGAVNISPEELKQLGIKAAFSIANRPMRLEYAMEHAEELCYNILVMVMNLITL